MNHLIRYQCSCAVNQGESAWTELEYYKSSGLGAVGQAVYSHRLRQCSCILAAREALLVWLQSLLLHETCVHARHTIQLPGECTHGIGCIVWAVGRWTCTPVRVQFMCAHTGDGIMQNVRALQLATCISGGRKSLTVGAGRTAHAFWWWIVPSYYRHDGGSTVAHSCWSPFDWWTKLDCARLREYSYIEYTCEQQCNDDVCDLEWQLAEFCIHNIC